MPDNPQSLQSHARFDPAFHFFLAPVFLLNLIFSIYYAVRYKTLFGHWNIVVALALLVAVFLIRSYALKNQDRLIRLEESLRFASLSPGTPTPILAPKQWVALRFASDSELPTLAQRAASQNLPPKDIKAAIQSWRPDFFRI